MANVLLPLIYFRVLVGTTIDIRNYDIPRGSIYNASDIVENPINEPFNASYYVLPDDKIPFEKIRVPIDYLLRMKSQGSGSGLKSMLYPYRVLTSENFDDALVLVVAEYRTSERVVKENANPLPDWQDRVTTSQTHYADKIVHGSQLISLIRVRTPVKGDAQIMRRILKDTMGTSGSVTPDTVELWEKAEKAIRESPDVRGEVYVDDYTKVINAKWGYTRGGETTVLRYVSEFPQHVYPPLDPALHDKYIRDPVYVSYKPLHELDEGYPLVTKDLEVERYLTKLYYMLRDIEFTESELDYFLQRISEENENKYRDFRIKKMNVKNSLREVFYSSLSAYKDINKVAMKEAFEEYYSGLDNTTGNYLTELRRLREKIVTGIRCDSDFYTPTTGVLRVAEDEVVKKGEVENFEKCRDFCIEDERCRAVGYSTRECLIYYRSTNSATITLPRGDSEDTKIYDRKCTFTW